MVAAARNRPGLWQTLTLFVFAVADLSGLVLAATNGDLRFFVVMMALTAIVVLWLVVRRLVRRSPRAYQLRLDAAFAWFSRLPRVASWLNVDSFQHRLSWYSRLESRRLGMRRALFVPKRLIRRRTYWPDWAFNIAVKFDGIEVDQYLDPQRRPTVRLNVTLQPDEFGVYNNPGKEFLRSRFGRQTTPQPADLVTFGTVCSPSQPLRWASGGALVVADWQGSQWIVLFFRDIRPIGWNIPNGGSESVEEQFDVQRLVFRELSEELVVLDGDPTDGAPRTQKPLVLPWTSQPTNRNPLFSRVFSAQQRRLRLEQDGLVIGDGRPADAHECPTWLVPAPFEVRIAEDLTRAQRVNAVRNMLFTVNPLEQGIELVHVLQIELSDHDTIVDGEILDFAATLARRPVALVQLDYLRGLFAAGGAVGSPASDDRKTLPSDLWAHVRLFRHDLDLRRRRVDHLQRTGRASRELAHHRDWLDRYEAAFTAVADGRPEPDEDLRTLCPVTWKSLEIAFRYGFL